MPIYEFASDAIQPLSKTTFSQAQLQERRDIQRLLRGNASVVAPDTLIIAEEFGDWDESRRRIDLLAVDRDANLVVIELKRTEDGGHMELQAIRYAAMVSTMTFDQAVDVFARHLTLLGDSETDARSELLEFLGWDEPDEDAFAQDVRIVLASGEFSRELTTSVLWLIDRGIDIRCVRLQPYSFDGRVLVDVQQIIPLPEVEEYQVRVAEKKRRERQSRTDNRDWTSYDVTIGADTFKGLRKRHAIYRMVQHHMAHGTSPERIAELCGRSVDTAFLSVAGEVDSEVFLRLAAELREHQGRPFEPRRWFCADDELFHHEGRTYAFLKQWGGKRFEIALTKLRDAFPGGEIDFQAVE